jgi:hypothetical protein
MVQTNHRKLMMAVPAIPSAAALSRHLLELEQVVQAYAVDDVIPKIQAIVPNFRTVPVAVVSGDGPVDFALH